MSKLDECSEHLLLLAPGPTPTDRLAARASVIVSDYWDLLDADERDKLRYWLDSLYADSLRPAFGPGAQGKLRVTEVALGAIDEFERKAPPERGQVSHPES